jgi:exonuclease III
MNYIIQWNINGLLKHFTDIQRIKYNIQLIVFCFQETNLKALQDFPLRGYDGHYKNRQNTTRASGGVTTYVSNLIQSKEIQIQSHLEVIAVIINIKNPICICNI